MALKYFLPYDVYERHKKVGKLIKNGQTVIDIGGQLNLLSQFASPAQILVANLEGSEEKSDVILKKDRLLFKDNSFDVVTAIDVFEHVPKDERENFTKELLRVAKDKVVLSFPIGTKEHISYEKELDKWLKLKGHEVIYLKEHIKYGLPTVGEINNITKNLKTKLTFSGDLKLNEFLFKFFLFDPKIFFLRRLIFQVKKVIYFLTNPFLYAMLSKKNFSNRVVRVYLILYKK